VFTRWRRATDAHKCSESPDLLLLLPLLAVVAPTTQAFAGLNIADIDAKTLLDVVTYHVCPFKRMYRLLVRDTPLPCAAC
jgi:hypothetical protein